MRTVRGCIDFVIIYTVHVEREPSLPCHYRVSSLSVERYMTDPRVEISVVKGRVTVSYRQEEGKWYATALEFDLVGSGNTRDAAFADLQQVVNCYIEEVIKAPGSVEFFNPSSREEWGAPDKEGYQVAIAIATVPRGRRIPPIMEPGSLHRLRNRIAGISLVPAF